ncbi:hypothetical protein [Kurthia huakuii]|uniref:hypothetical protein n=1 Tax=Kurthia huakuii TaxID=1421019 RepID=UPI000494DF12|nr:hypothetical protein [Kurthia huakuii]MBM7697877.1 cytoskeletal protein RodZ [Kurthia huakuii]
MAQEEAQQRAEKPKKKNPVLGLSIFVVVVIALFFGINYFLVHNDIQDAEKQSQNLSAQIDHTTDTIEKKQRIPEVVLHEAVAFAKEEKISLTPVFAALLKDGGSSAALTGITYDDSGMQVKMNFSTLQDATKYQKTLAQNTDIFTAVDMEKVAAYTPVAEDDLASKPEISSTARYQAVFNVTLNKDKLQQAQQAKEGAK